MPVLQSPLGRAPQELTATLLLHHAMSLLAFAKAQSGTFEQKLNMDLLEIARS
jgi:hypothetical protein